jgi:membrane protease YdiL (CAAX protease family)
MNSITLPTKRPFNKKVFLFLVLLLIPAIYAGLPYAFTLTSTFLWPSELVRVLILQLVNVAIYAALAAIGLYLASRIGLGLPFIEGWLKKEPMWDKFRKVLVTAAVVGVVAGVAVILIDVVVFGPPLEAELKQLEVTIPETIQPPPWQGALASFSAGVTEEVFFRLFLLTGIAWLGSLVFKDSEGRPTSAVLWSATILVAVLFGLAHLPTAISIGIPLTPLFITRSIVLNGVVGVACGWLYFTRGLESAMVAHFSADIILHVLFVLIAPLLM